MLLGLGKIGDPSGDLGANVPVPVVNPQTASGGYATWYCNSFMGQLFSPTTCHIPSQAELSAGYAAELAATRLTPDAQAAAIAASNAALAADQAAHPADYAAQQAASTSPLLSSFFNPGTVASVQDELGNIPNPLPTLDIPSWALWLAAGVLVWAVVKR